MPTIEPCPFCGCATCDVVELHHQPGDAFVVGCPDCGGIGPAAITDDSAIELWNGRVA